MPVERLGEKNAEASYGKNVCGRYHCRTESVAEIPNSLRHAFN